MPRVRFGKVHILNCLYSSNTAHDFVGGGYRSNIYIEKCAFTNTEANAWLSYTSSEYPDYNYQITSCVGASDVIGAKGTYTQFVPTYSYDSYDASQVESTLKSSNGAGATLTIHEKEKFTTAYKR